MKNFKSSVYPILLLYVILAGVTIFYYDGTGGSGDSIMHFLFAKYAPQHPALYFDHWAKPVFVLLASPFAQFGFNGMKVFNALCVLLTIYFTYRICEKMKYLNSYAVAIFLVFSPMYFILTFSGLTEPLFALFLSLGIYLIVSGNYAAAIILISFLPFVRSEGLILLGVFGLYLLIRKKWKLIPLLSIGHIVYSIAGYFVYKDIFWVFHKIPYARLDAVYGRGELTHFAGQLYYILGLPSLFLFISGFICIIRNIIKGTFSTRMLILVYGGFLSFFIAHSLFWYLGIFGSMGLTRVFICVIPLMTIIMLKGFNMWTEELFPKRKNILRYVQIALIGYVMLFPFTKTHGAIIPERDLTRSIEQNTSQEIQKFFNEQGITPKRIACVAPYLAMELNFDPFDNAKHTDLNPENLKQMNSGDMIIWDNHFALKDNKITRESISENPAFENVFNTRATENENTIEFAVFVKK
ncbi:hypothetical protein BH09BAC5_BH09BAC5_23530 [soil metagenome]